MALKITRPIDLALAADGGDAALAWYSAAVDQIIEFGQCCVSCGLAFSEDRVPAALASLGEYAAAGICIICSVKDDAALIDQAQHPLYVTLKRTPRC
jgi:hypothetical protein